MRERDQKTMGMGNGERSENGNRMGKGSTHGLK